MNGILQLDGERIDLLIEEGESLTVEFKESYTPHIVEDIVAFSNTKGGYVLLGVRDDGSIKGIKLSNEMKARITSIGRNCEPPISVNATQVNDIVVIEVQEGKEKPYSCKGGFFRRLNGATQKMNNDEIRVMFSENDPLPFEERIVKGMTFKDISKEKVRTFLRTADLNIGKSRIEDFLRSLGVADGSGVKLAGALFFASKVGSFLPHARITLLAFKGTEKRFIYDRMDVEDDLFTQFNETITFLMKHLNVRSEIHGVDRTDIYELPLEALREAVVNAIQHRDYSIRGTQINVEVYEDRVEIINPGGLPKGLNVEDLGTLSVRRNERIADLFYRLGKVERIGMGVVNMRIAMRSAGLEEPRFETNGFFRAVFPRPGLIQKGIVVSEKDTSEPDEMSEERRKNVGRTSEKIIQAIEKNKAITISELASLIGVTERTIERNIKKLRSNGSIRRVGPTKGGHWEVVG